jgi:hypothetical protein
MDVDGAVASEASASKRPRERTSSKVEAKRDTSSQAVMETIMTLLITKEVSSEKRDDNIQHKKFAIEDIHAHNRRKGLELALLATHVNDYESYSTSMVVEENP